MPALNSRDFYLDRAAAARAEAETTTLAHARERYLASEAAWLDLADRAGRIERRRAREAEPLDQPAL